VVFKNDEKTVEELRAMNPRGILVSPGPGAPPQDLRSPPLQALAPIPEAAAVEMADGASCSSCR
jgi:anthranilate/para-aminobenzoate synthase component II